MGTKPMQYSGYRSCWTKADGKQPTASRLLHPMARSPDSFSVSLPPCGGTIVFAFELHHPTHFLQSRTHPFADSVAEGLFSHGTPCGKFVGRLTLSCRCRFIRKVGGDDSGALVVVPRI